MPEDLLPVRERDAIPLNRNIKPVSECSLVTSTIDGRTHRAVEVPILTCGCLWLECQKEAEDVISINGKIIQDSILRNQRINAAYARLSIADKRFQWAGLAAFASKQVGCGLLHAVSVMGKNQADIRRVGPSHSR